MTSQPLFETVPACMLRPWDRVTETCTPTGPWYVVAGVDTTRRLVTVHEGRGLLVDVPMPPGAGLVLRRVTAVP